MLSIAKLSAKHTEYYLAHVGGRDDLQAATAYYADADPDTSLWRGRGAEYDNLSGAVSRDQLEHLLAGDHPTTGRPLTEKKLKNPAYDLCFSAPKSVSLLWGSADPKSLRQCSTLTMRPSRRRSRGSRTR